MKRSALFLLIYGSFAYAGEISPYLSLTDLSREVRDPVFTSEKRREILDHTRKKMAKLLSEEMKVSVNELNLTFMKNPTKLNILMQDQWFDLQTEFYTTLHQENFRQRWMELQRLVKFSEYGKNIYGTMMNHIGNYSPVEENRFYLRWHNIGLTSDGKTRKFKIPYFLMSEKIKDLIEIEAHVPFEELIKPKDLPLFLSKTSTITRVERQELAEKMDLNRRILLRAAANGAKTIASIQYLTGASSRHETEEKISAFLNRFCLQCSMKDKEDSLKGAMAYVDLMRKSIIYDGPSSVASNFCTSLKKNKYNWNVEKMKPTPQEIISNQARVGNFIKVDKLKKQNIEAISKAILEQDLGILFLTKSITLLDKEQKPVGTNFECHTGSSQKDTEIVLSSIEEAEKNVSQYITHIHEKYSKSLFNFKLTNETLEYFVQTNQAATVESTSAYPQGIGWVLKSLAELEQNIHRREKIDSILMWGGNILGIALTITGVGAPEGVAMIIASIGVVKGASTGTYYLIRARHEKAFIKEMQLSKKAGTEISQENLHEHYEKYKTLKIFFIKEYVQSGLNFIGLHRMVMKKTDGNIEQVHESMDRVFESVKATGKDQAMDQIQDLVIGMAVGAT